MLSSFKQSNLSIIWIILLIVVLNLCDSMVSTILLSSAIFMVETEEELNQFNGLQQSVDSSCSLLGPIIAAIIYPYVSIGFAIGVEIFLESLAIVAILFLRLHKKSIFNDTGEEFSSELSISSIIERRLYKTQFVYWLF